MKEKTVTCLQYAAMPYSEERREFYNDIVSKHSEKVIKRKLQELERRGYVAKSHPTTIYDITEHGRVFLEVLAQKPTI